MPVQTSVPATQISLEEYLRTCYRPDCDYVDGELEERNVGEREHSILQIAIGAWFFNRRTEWGIVVMSEQRTRVSSERVRLPDLCIVSASAPMERVTQTPPLLAIEILSSEDRLSRVIQRLDDFLQMGVADIWLIDPVERVAFTYSSNGLCKVGDSHLAIPNSPIYLDLGEVFAALD